MRIVQVAHAFPPYHGGLSHVVENLSIRLVKRGFDVEVVTLDVGMNLPGLGEYNGVIVRRFRGYAPLNAYYIPSRGFIKYLSEIDTDDTIFHLHNLGSVSTYYAWRTLHRKEARIVLSPHYHESGSTIHTRLLWRIYRILAKKIVDGSDRLHAVSRFEAELLKRHFGADALVIPNGVGGDVFQYRWTPPPDKIVLTYAGRVEGYKRVDLIVRYARMIWDGRDVVVRIIGEGSDLERILKLSKKLGVNIEHHRFLDRKAYLDMLSRSSVFINLSSYEAFSIVTAEALAIGVPAVVAKPWGRTFSGCSRAFIVDPASPANVVGSIKKALRLENEDTPAKCPVIRSWDDVVDALVEKLYTGW